MDGLVQDSSISIANTLEILQSRTQPRVWYLQIYISAKFVLAAKYMYPFIDNAQDCPHCLLYRLYFPLKSILENNNFLPVPFWVYLYNI